MFLDLVTSQSPLKTGTFKQANMPKVMVYEACRRNPL